jgi:hypothetical protein
MNSLKTLVKEYLYETLYEAQVVLRSSRDNNITIISDNLRGVCGITVCTIASPAKPVSAGYERTLLNIKFHRLQSSMQKHLETMSLEARRIDGVSSFIVKRVDKVRNRIYRSE